MKKTIAFSLVILAVMAVIGVIWLTVWTRERINKARVIEVAIANPQDIDPEVFLASIDHAFVKMEQSRQQELLGDPVALEDYIAQATQKELQRSFGVLFQMPEAVRRRVISRSAGNLREKTRSSPGAVDDFFDSVAGRGALRGASNYFATGLSGRQKAEARELTHEMYKIVREQKERRR